MYHESIRHWLLYEFLNGSDVDKAWQKISKILPENEHVHKRTVEFWFKRFQQGNFSVKTDLL